ncbi:siderophore-interacting protein [Ketobacter sp.]
MSKPRRLPPRPLQVVRSTLLNPKLVRITLGTKPGGTELNEFPEDSRGDHIKLMFPRAHQTVPKLPTLGPDGPVWPAADERPITRTYSVSQFRAEQGELDVDFVLHSEGPGSLWAESAKPGDAVGLAGPGGPKRVKPGADWYLLVADPSSYAAFAAALDSLPPHATGYALIEVGAANEEIETPHPPGIELRWLVREQGRAGESRLLIDAVQELAWLRGTPSVMVSGENAQVIAIRNYVVREHRVPKAMIYAVPYWKDLHDEERYHQERHRIMDEMDEAE